MSCSLKFKVLPFTRAIVAGQASISWNETGRKTIVMYASRCEMSDQSPTSRKQLSLDLFIYFLEYGVPYRTNFQVLEMRLNEYLNKNNEFDIT